MIQATSYAVVRDDLGEAVREANLSAEGCIATQILPVRKTKKKAAAIPVISRENMKRSDAKHANGAAFNRANGAVTDVEYSCKDYGLEGQLTDTDRENYGNDFDAEIETTAIIENKIAMEREIRVAAKIFNTTTWTGAALYTDVSAAPWDAAGSDVIGHVGAAKNKVRTGTGYKANSLIIGAVTLQNILNNTAIKARFVGVDVVTEAILRANMAAIFGLKNLIVGEKVYDSAAENQDFVGADIWSDDYAMICKINEGSTISGGIGRTILWELITADLATVDMYREEQTKSDIIRVNEFTDEKIFDAAFGHLLKVDA
jgi:hypothetical protein